MSLRIAALAALAAACFAVAGPATARGVITPPALNARAAILVSPSTGQVLYDSGAGRELPIASTTKLMTALVTLQHVRDLRQMFTQNNYVPTSYDSQIGLAPGERMSVHDLLIALLLPSADDAAEDLAYNVGGGSVARFVGMMNAQARKLGLLHTHYSTPSGLDTPGNYSSASDLVKLADFLLRRYPFIAQVVAEPSATLATGSHPRQVTNINDLVGSVPWIRGVKTGHTLGAGYVLVGAGARDGMTLLSAVLGAPSVGARDADTLALFDYGFGSFRPAAMLHRGEVVGSEKVPWAARRISLVASGGFEELVPRSASVVTRVQEPRRLWPGLRAGDQFGAVLLVVDGRVAGRAPLLLSRDVPPPSFSALLAASGTSPTTLALLVALLSVPAALLLVRRQRARGRKAARLETA